MDIKKRINARKIVLSYFYQHCFFSVLKKTASFHKESLPNQVFSDDQTQSLLSSVDQKSDFLDADFLKVVEEKKNADLYLDKMVYDKICTYSEFLPLEGEFDYILHHFFDQWASEEVDIEYVLKVGNALPRYQDELIKKVDRYAESF